MNPTVDRYCIMTQGDTHESFRRNLVAARPPVPVYLRDSHRAQDVRDYMEQVQQVESACFNTPSPRFALAHFGLNGPAMVVTAEADGQVVAAQYVIWDGHVEGRRGLRFWTTVVHPSVRGQHVASTLTAISTVATRSWAEYGSTICDTNSSLMRRNVRLCPIIVTSNMFHTEGRRKVQLEWDPPADPFRALLLPPLHTANGEVTSTMHTLATHDADTPIQGRFYVPADAQVWEDIANAPEHYRRRFRLVGWVAETKGAILEDTRAHLLHLAAPEQVRHEPEPALVLI
jgi:hypothetical protein